MEKKTISEETLKRVKTLPRIDYLTYLELINQKQVIRLVKLKRARTIFFDEELDSFLYLSPYHLCLCECGKFNDQKL
jgi:hypothetical protein